LCGIFGFALTKPVPLSGVFRVLERLEVCQYPGEETPVGGYGAGIALLLVDGSVIYDKVGKVNGSPARRLSEIMKTAKASVLLGHVRMPSPEFMQTAKLRETAQPYVVEHNPDCTVVSVHNGRVENYKQIRAELGRGHVFESERTELIDSEVIPHLFWQLLNEKSNANEALDELCSTLEGPSAIGMLQIDEEGTLLHFIHKGKTRGLTIWANKQDEIVFCSRKEPLTPEFASLLAEGKFEEKVSIGRREEKSLKLSFAIKG